MRLGCEKHSAGLGRRREVIPLRGGVCGRREGHHPGDVGPSERELAIGFFLEPHCAQYEIREEWVLCGMVREGVHGVSGTSCNSTDRGWPSACFTDVWWVYVWCLYAEFLFQAFVLDLTSRGPGCSLVPWDILSDGDGAARLAMPPSPL